MNKMYRFKRIGLLAIGIIIIQFAFSQEYYKSGYVVNKNSDTIFGLVDHRDWGRNPDVIKFKTNIENDPIFFKPTDINGFRVEDEIYVSGIINTLVSPAQLGELEFDSRIKTKVVTAFVQALIRGEKSLYYYISSTGIASFYIEQDTGFDLLVYKKYLVQQGNENNIIEDKKYVGQLTVYLNDCATILSKLENTLYTKTSLIKAFRYYYECVPSDIYFQKKIEKVNFEIGVLAGASLTSLEFVSYDDFLDLVNADYNSSTNFTAGLFFDLILPVSQRKWSINNEILISTYKVKGSYTNYVHENYYSVTSTEIGYSYLKINNLLRFKFPVGPLFLFLNGGISNGFSLSETNNKRKESKFHSTERVVEGLVLDDTRKYERGLILGAGAKYDRFSFEVRYEMGNGMSKVLSLKSSTERYYLLLSYKI